MDTITLANLLKNQLLNNGIITLSGIGEIVVVDVTPPLVQLVFVLVLYSLQIFAA